MLGIKLVQTIGLKRERHKKPEGQKKHKNFSAFGNADYWLMFLLTFWLSVAFSGGVWGGISDGSDRSDGSDLSDGSDESDKSDIGWIFRLRVGFSTPGRANGYFYSSVAANSMR